MRFKSKQASKIIFFLNETDNTSIYFVPKEFTQLDKTPGSGSLSPKYPHLTPLPYGHNPLIGHRLPSLLSPVVRGHLT